MFWLKCEIRDIISKFAVLIITFTMTDFASQEVQLSLIICSINPEQCADAVKSMEETAGCRIEAIVIDNRERHWPIAKAYNEGAKQAKSEALLFVHEDVIFRENDWVKALLEKLAEPKTGVIGFSGSKVWAPVLSGCSLHDDYTVDSYAWPQGERIISLSRCDRDDKTFVPVITVDGLAMAVRKDVWEKHPFDEVVLTGFHCYDVDFSLTLANAGYTNYVWRGIRPLHLSQGNFGAAWAKMTFYVWQNKWKNLPRTSTLDGDIRWEDAEAQGQHRWAWAALTSETSSGLKDKALQIEWRNRKNKYVKKHIKKAIKKWLIHRFFNVASKRK